MIGSTRFALLASAIIVVVAMGCGGGAAYAEEGYTLTVKSTPISGIAITSTGHVADGLTDYSVTCSGYMGLHAPSAPLVDGLYYKFVGWELDGQPKGSGSLYYTMNRDHVAVAVYKEYLITITVDSAPMTGVSISGDLPGTTSYSALYNRARAITLVAPDSVATDEGVHPFVQWMIRGYRAPQGQTSLQIPPSSGGDPVALYLEFHPVLTVESSPGGIPIQGGRPGTTPYTVACTGGETVTFVAPAEFTNSNGETYLFDYWQRISDRSVTTLQYELAATDTTSVRAYYKRKPVALAIRSEPFTGVAITGHGNLTTDYEGKITPGEKMELTAPSVVQRDGTTYRLHRWFLNGVAQPELAPKLSFKVSGPSTCVAVYAEITLLTVSSSVDYIGIEGDKPGITPYTALCFEPGAISLTAPPSTVPPSPGDNSLAGTIYEFSHWEIDGLPQPSQQNTAVLTMNCDHSVAAIYNRPPQMTVRSMSAWGVPIGGDRPGTTRYAIVCRGGPMIRLEAPEIFIRDNIEHHFYKWVISDGRTWREPVVEVALEPDGTADVYYTTDPPRVKVESSPSPGAFINGSRPGTTGYTVHGEYLEVMSLIAPTSISSCGSTLEFARWVIDKVNQPLQEPTALLTARGEHSAIALYGNAVLRIQGPADRSEPPLPSGGGTFTVDLFLSNVGLFAGFETAGLQFLDASGKDAAFLIGQRPGGNPSFDNMEIELDDARWPNIFPFVTGVNTDPSAIRRFFGFLCLADSSVTDEVRLCTITYEYGPSAEGTYSIATDLGFTNTIVANAEGIVFNHQLPGTVVIGLAADMNDDCIVNELDLLALRDLLGQNVSPGMRGDLNGDGVINTLDLIVLRNKMGKTCK